MSKAKLEYADENNSFLRGEVKDLAVLLHAQIQTSPHGFKTYRVYFEKTLIKKWKHFQRK